ncbi:MAG: ABC transporter permease, partial [Propionibacteriaceae bacterium]|nr:ABC transporter permease [Propionibacteriaceae bacterium]
GFVIGMVQALGIYLTDDKFRDLFIFGAFLLVLLLRPHGLFGSRHAVVSEPMTGTFLGAGRPIRIPAWVWVVLAVVAGLVVPWLGGGAVGTQVVLYAIIAVPMTLLAGSTGQISLGQAAPVAIGAYASALLVMRLDMPFLLALLSGGVIAAVLATVVTLPMWKLDGHYVSMATLALGYIVLTIIRGWEPLTQGALGLSGIPAPEIFGLPLLVSDDHYQLDLVLLGLTLFVVIKLRSSHLGTVLAAVGSDEVASRSLGLKTRSYKALAYAIVAFFAGVAGALTAHQFTYLDPTMFPVQMSVLALTIVVLGGINSPFGAVLGSVALIGLPEAFRIAPDVRIILYGLVVILIIRFRPQGLWARRA